MKREIKPADGKLMVFVPGMGAITTTVLAGIFNIKKGLSEPVGSLTQMGHIRLGKRTDDNQPMIKDFVPLYSLENMEFAGWTFSMTTCMKLQRTLMLFCRSILNP